MSFPHGEWPETKTIVMGSVATASPLIREHTSSALCSVEVEAISEMTEEPIGISKEEFPLLQCHTRIQSSARLVVSISKGGILKSGCNLLFL